MAKTANRGRFSLLLLVTLAAGCSGGGGDDDRDPRNPPGGPPVPDTTPTSFAFAAKGDVAPGASVDSDPVTITGIAAAAPVSITGGEYAINGGAFTSANGTIENAQSIVVRVTASGDTFKPVTATVTIGGVSASFTATTAPDTEPDTFSFANALGATLSAAVDSPSATITGIDVPVPVTISGGEYAIDGGAFTAADATIADGQSLVVRVVAADTFSTSTSATVTVGGVAATFTATTVPDTIPDTFSFVDEVDVALGAQVDSAPVVIGGIEAPTPVAISGGSYAIDGGPFTNAAGLVDNGQAIVVRVTAATSPITTVEATLTVGGVSDTFSATTIPDTTPPTATIAFPPLTSRTSADTIRLRGRARDDMSTVVAVRVNGALATTTDAFATWSATVPLAPDVNVVTIETEDSEGNVDASAAEATVRRRLRFGDVQGIALGAAPDTILAVDSAARALTSVDLVNDERRIVSDNAAGGPDFAFLIPRTVVLDPADPDGRAFVLDPSMEAILSVDLSTGARTIFSNATIPSTNAPFVSASDMALDAANDRLLVLAAAIPSIVAVALDTGERTILSDAGSAGPMFSGLGRIAIDVANDRALVADFAPPYRIIAVSLASGARSVLSDEFTPNASNPLTFPAAIAVDALSSRALVAQPETDSILAVSLVTGERTVFTSSTIPNAVDPIGDVAALAVDTANERLVAVEADGQRRIFGISLLNGERTILSSDEPAGTANLFVEPKGIMLDAANGRALVTDSARGAVIALDLATAERTVFSDANVPNMASPFSWPGEIVPDLVANRAFVLDELRGVDEAEIIALDLASGARTIVTSNVFPDAANPLTNPSNLALDSARNRLLVSDPAAAAVLAVDIDLGTRIVFSSNAVPDGVNPYTTPRGIVIDEARNRGLVVNSTNSFASQLLELDVVSGARSVFSDVQTPDGQNPFSGPTSLALDAGNDRLFLVDRQLSQIATVDLTTAARTIVSYNFAPFPANPFGGPEGIAYDADNEVLYVVNQWFDGVLAVDTTTGHRIYVMR